MNRDDFDARYELIEQVTEGAIETHHALHRSGVVVMVHFVTGPSLQDDVHRSVGRLQATGSEGLIHDVQRIDDRVVVITRFIMDFVSLRDWFAAQGAPMGGTGTGAFGETLSPRPGGGEFTRLFSVDPPPMVDDPTMVDHVRAADDAGESTTPTTSDLGPGEQRSSEPDRSASPRAPADTDRGEAPAGPGEFTKMFQALPARPPSSSSPAPAASPTSTDPPTSTEPPSSTELPASPASPPEGTKDQPGEFTRLFRVDSPPPASQDQRAEPDRRDGAGPGPAAHRRADTPADTGAGEFTRFFQGIQPKEVRDREGGTERPAEEPFPWAGLDTPRSGQAGGESAQSKDDQWADALRSERRPPPDPPPTPTPASTSDSPPAPQPGGFTQIFGAHSPTPPAGSSSAPSAPPPASRLPTESAAASDASGAPPGASGGGAAARVPRMPRASIPDPEALIRGARPRPTRPRVPGAREAARAAVGATLARSGESGGGEGQRPSPEVGGAPKQGLSTKTFAIGLVVIVLLSLALVAAITLLAPGSGPTSNDVPVADSLQSAPSDSAG